MLMSHRYKDIQISFRKVKHSAQILTCISFVLLESLVSFVPDIFHVLGLLNCF